MSNNPAQEWKEKGNAFVKEQKYKEALICYNEAINIDPTDPIIYSNRSAMHSNLKDFENALKDANKAIELKKDYAKAYLRKGKALIGLSQEDDALTAFKQGLEKEPNNQQLKDAYEELDIEINNPYKKNYNKLFIDPKTARYMTNPEFKNMVDRAMKDHQLFFQLVQTEPRFEPVFAVLTGLDLNKMNDDVMKQRKEEEEQKKFNALSEEEKAEIINKKKADDFKLEGNENYKNKNYEEAIKFYKKAIETYPKELTYHLNTARCYIALKDYEKTIEYCKKIIDGSNDFTKRANAFGIMGYAYQGQNKLDEAIKAFEDSLLEKNDSRIKDALKEAQNLKKKMDEKP